MLEFGAAFCGVEVKDPGGQGRGGTKAPRCAGLHLPGVGDEKLGVGNGDLAGLKRAGDGGAANRGDEERSACGRVLHEGVFRNGGG
jgi:hypothetical protein